MTIALLIIGWLVCGFLGVWLGVRAVGSSAGTPIGCLVMIFGPFGLASIVILTIVDFLSSINIPDIFKWMEKK